MKMLLVNEQNRFALDEHGQMILGQNPELGFEYVFVAYTPNERLKWLVIEGEVVPCALNPEDIEAIEQFIDAERERRGVTVRAIDAEGRFLGVVRDDDPRIAERAITDPPNQDGWVWRSGAWVRAYGFDESGAPCHMNEGVGFTTDAAPAAPGGCAVKWNGKVWEVNRLEGFDPEEARQQAIGAAAAITMQTAAYVMVGSRGTAALGDCLTSIAVVLESSGIGGEAGAKLKAISKAANVFLRSVMAGGSIAECQAIHESTMRRISGTNITRMERISDQLIINEYLAEHE